MGAAHVFVRDKTTWTYEAKLIPPDRLEGDRFGADVAVIDDNSIIVIGLPLEYNILTFGHIFLKCGDSWNQRQVSKKLEVDWLFSVDVQI